LPFGWLISVGKAFLASPIARPENFGKPVGDDLRLRVEQKN
jgi:hypothetical protein